MSEVYILCFFNKLTMIFLPCLLTSLQRALLPCFPLWARKSKENGSEDLILQQNFGLKPGIPTKEDVTQKYNYWCVYNIYLYLYKDYNIHKDDRLGYHFFANSLIALSWHSVLCPSVCHNRDIIHFLLYLLTQQQSHPKPTQPHLLFHYMSFLC